MAKGFRWAILADVRDWLKGTSKVTDSLDDVAEALDAVGDDARPLEQKFSKAFKAVQDDAGKAGKRIGKDLKDGTDKASEGVEEFKDEAQSSAREAAASFNGEFDDVADYIRDIAAQAFAGFGPAGAAAGVAAAVGIGFLISTLESSAEKAAETKDQVIDLATQLAEVDGNPAAIDWAEHLQTVLNEIVDTKSWWEFWQDEPETRLEQWSRAAEKLGLSLEDAVAGLSGDSHAMTRFMDDLQTRLDAANRKFDELTRQGVEPFAAAQQAGVKEIEAFQRQIEEQAGVIDDAKDYYDLLAEAAAGVSETQQAAAEATSDYQESVAQSLSKAGEAWEQYTTDGIVNLEEYNAAIEKQAAAAEAYEQNLVAASEHLSAEALSYIQSLGIESAPLLQAFVDAPLDQKERTAANWQAIGKTATSGYAASLDVKGATARAIDAAQAEADQRKIQIRAGMDEHSLHLAVQRALAGLGTPTITIRGEVRPSII